MKSKALCAALLSGLLLFTGCSSMNKTSKGSIVGAGTGAGVGAAVGALIGKNGKSAAIGAAIGTAVGTTAGAVIGRQMDKAAEQAAAIEGAKVESFTDNNELKALKVTFDSGILFEFNKSSLNQESQRSLAKFSQILVDNPTMDIMIFGHTDNVGTLQANQKVSTDRAEAVARFIRASGVPPRQIKQVTGRNFADPVASNNTEAGRALNRRVEIYMYASEEMIKQAEQASR